VLVGAREAPGERLLPALIAGDGVGGLLEQAYGPTSTPDALRSPLCGKLAGAPAEAHLCGLDAGRSAAALAKGALFTGGMLQSCADGTHECRYQVGVVARNALAAVELARASSRSGSHAFEGRTGFVRACARSDCERGALLARLGRQWSAMRVTFSRSRLAPSTRRPSPSCWSCERSSVAALLRAFGCA
jgi:2-methylcitrate dehydratase PrpD